MKERCLQAGRVAGRRQRLQAGMLRSDTGEALLRWKYQRYIKDYLSVARSLDRNIGRLQQYLDEKGLTGNTVVIYAQLIRQYDDKEAEGILEKEVRP